MSEGETVRILVVDDQAVSRMLICHYLEENGLASKAVTNCEDALYEINSGNYDLLALDILIPGMGGLELLRLLRTRFSVGELPIIMITSVTDPETKIHALELGANDYITKPVDPTVTISKIRTHLSIHKYFRKLRESEDRYSLAVRGANEGVWDWDLKTNVIYYSPRLCSMLEPDGEKAIFPNLQEWIERIHPEERKLVVIEMQEHLRGKTNFFESQHRIVQPDGSFRWILARGLAVKNELDEPVRMVGTLSDISRSLTYDNVTGLPSKHVFFDLLERSLARSMRSDKSLFALLLVSIDRYEEIAAALGVTDTDKLIATTSRRLQLSSRASDILARIKPAQFGVILDDIGQVSDALRVANRMSDSLHAPIHVADQQYYITPSIGIAVSSSSYDKSETMLADAEKALASAQAAGGNQSYMADVCLHAKAQQHLQLETELIDALLTQQFLVYYQPIVDVRNHTIVGFEPLLRWQRSNSTILEPRDFLHICKHNQIILSIGAWLIKRSLEQLKYWQKINITDTELFLTVNLSKEQFWDHDLLDILTRTIQELHMPPEVLRFDIDEEVVACDFGRAFEIIAALVNNGFKVGLDKFSSGKSSSVEMAKLPLSYIKIDKALVADLEQTSNIVTVKVIRAFAEFLNMPLVAVGIENKAQEDAMAGFGFYYQQGFFSFPPTSDKQLSKILLDRNADSQN